MAALGRCCQIAGKEAGERWRPATGYENHCCWTGEHSARSSRGRAAWGQGRGQPWRMAIAMAHLQAWLRFIGAGAGQVRRARGLGADVQDEGGAR
ncbi:hypothetical protein FH972_025187 [Carpinus fangiana]|uniref:Uncharacterized protein n=1 Tax=Carpinus fangiana TaxID=176857 RepID=A0A5N6L0M1_9ROSI|nr:hypothetical protein FH972_025187 [Carpinus fangiana]